MEKKTLDIEKTDPLYAKVILNILSASPLEIEKLKEFLAGECRGL